jgi:hypothetical protein
MKLTNQQLTSLSSKIYSEIKIQKNSEKNTAIETWKQSNQDLINETLNPYNHVCNLLDGDLVHSIRINQYGREYRDSEALKNNLIEDLIFKNIDTEPFVCPHTDKIYQELVLATIECDNLQELIDSVKSKF